MPADDFIGRYSRQTLFRPIGADGQTKLSTARVAIVGLGALGTVVSTQLVRAGVGFVRLIDRDIIEPSNLQRQSLYDEEDAAAHSPKAATAKRKLEQTNSAVHIEAIIDDLTARNAEACLSDVDVIVDGTDNFQTRYLINDIAVQRAIPWSYGGAVSSYGTTGFIRPGITPCLVCLFGTNPGGGHDTCDTIGVLAPIVSIIASLQATEVLKWLTGNTTALSPGLTYVDVWQNEFRAVDYPSRDVNCPCCVQGQFEALGAADQALTVSLCGRRTIQVKPATPLQGSLATLGRRLSAVGSVRQNDDMLRLDLGDIQVTVFQDGRALIHGTEDPATARGLYARYIGM